MLTDIERKTLRVLFSWYNSQWVRPDLVRGVRLSRRDERRIKAAVKAAGYIESKDGHMRFVRAFEMETVQLQ